jgi:hypothetical protein
MTCKLDRVCDQLRIKLHGIDRRLEALKGNAMALSEKSQGVVESQLERIEQRIYDSRISVDAANTRVKTWHDGKKAGFDARRESWKKERRFHQLNSRADDTEAYAIGVRARRGGGRRGGAGGTPGAPRPQRRQPRRAAPGLGRRGIGGAGVTRIAVAAALVALAASTSGALARDSTAPRAAGPATRAREQPGPMDAAEATRQANAARLAQKAREDEWDRKTGQATRSICTGAKGC